MDINKPKLIILSDLADKLLTSAQIPLYSAKHSKKTFTNHQLFKLLIIKSYWCMDYRRFVECLETSAVVLDHLGLNRIPHFTTLQKFAQRQNIQKLEKLLAKFVNLAPKKMRNGGLDSSYFRISRASEHYEKRIGRPIKKKDFLKANCFFDLENMLILAIKTRKENRHDMHDMKILWNKIKHFDFKKLFGDKAYDANWLHQLIFESGRKSMIHIKQEEIPIWRTHGEFRKKAKRLAKNKEKGKRSLVETIFSILKRIYSSTIRARDLTNQKIELIFRIITCNLERIAMAIKNNFLRFFIFLVFLQKLRKNANGIWSISPVLS